MKFLALDNETGGLNDKVSLLTSYFAVLNDDLEIVDELDLFLKPYDGVYSVEAQGLAINQINLIEHDKIAETKETAGQKLFKFLKAASNAGADKFIPIGHNVMYDIISVHKELLNRETFEQFVSYRKLDTASIAQFLKLARKIPNELSGSLGSLALHFNVVNPAPHTGRGDVLTTVSVLKKMISLVQS